MLVSGVRRDAKIYEVLSNGRWCLPASHDDEVLKVWRMIRTLRVNTGATGDISWTNHSSGLYTIKSGWDALRNRKNKVEWAKIVWGVKVTFPVMLSSCGLR